MLTESGGPLAGVSTTTSCRPTARIVVPLRVTDEVQESDAEPRRQVKSRDVVYEV
jgi:hypothetical protein